MQVPPLPPARCPQTNLSVQLLRWLPVAHSCGVAGGCSAITEFCGLLTDGHMGTFTKFLGSYSKNEKTLYRAFAGDLCFAIFSKVNPHDSLWLLRTAMSTAMKPPSACGSRDH